jgi:phospholipid/cholesterol/gamma-HCH transport system substrate-binding protein
MHRSYLETVVGFIVLIVAAAFSFNAYNDSGMRKDELSGYNLNVSFDRVDGLAVGAEVKVSGLKVGTVVDAQIDPQTYQAKVILNLQDEVQLPDDSSAEIISAGLLGDKYIALVPGGSEEFFKDGDKIKFSQPSISIEALIGKFMFGSSDDKKEGEGDKEETSTF